jgi:hypothetical protein
MTRYQLAVCGSNEVNEAIVSKAELIGKLVAQAGHIVLTGATVGYSWHAAKAAREAGGLTIGISPAENRAEHINTYKLPTDAYQVLITTGFGRDGRNVVLARSCDAMIVIGGRIGTVEEFLIAFQSGKVIGVLKGSGGNTDALPGLVAQSSKQGGVVIYENDPQMLLDKVIASLQE